MRPRGPLSLPDATAEQWAEAFRDMERCFGRNRERMWVLKCMKDRLRQLVEPQEEE